MKDTETSQLFLYRTCQAMMNKNNHNFDMLSLMPYSTSQIHVCILVHAKTPCAIEWNLLHLMYRVNRNGLHKRIFVSIRPVSQSFPEKIVAWRKSSSIFQPWMTTRKISWDCSEYGTRWMTISRIFVSTFPAATFYGPTPWPFWAVWRVWSSRDVGGWHLTGIPYATSGPWSIFAKTDLNENLYLFRDEAG